MQCDGAELLAIVEYQAADRDVAELTRLFKDYIVHWRQIAWRAVDDLQDLGRRGLVLQRLFEIASALPQFELWPEVGDKLTG